MEFGGGYGSLCRVFWRAGFRGCYWIHDVPSFSLLQVFFLKSVGLEAVYEPRLSSWSRVQGITCFNRFANGAPPSKAEAYKTLYIATWSLSEVGPEYRAAQEQVIGASNYFLFAFRDEFQGFDNLAYFTALTERRRDIVWQLCAIPHISKSYYMFGRPSALNVEH